MKISQNFRPAALMLVAAGLLLAYRPAFSQDAVSPDRLTPEFLQTQILAARDSDEFDEESKTRLIGLLRQALANIQTQRINEQAADAYREERRQAPIETASILTAIELRAETDPTADLQSVVASSDAALESALEEELANQTAADATRAGLDRNLERESLRPTEVRDRITTARLTAEELATASAINRARPEEPMIAEAAAWADESRLSSLQAELAMLDQELLSHRQRVELLRAQREEAALSVLRIGQRVELLRSVLNDRRRLQAEAAIEQATIVLADSEFEQPALQELAEENLRLVDLLQRQLEELDRLSEQERLARPLSVDLEETFRNTRSKLQLGGAGAPIGLAIQEQRRRLPDSTVYERQRGDLQATLTELGLRILDNEESRFEVNNIGSFVDGLLESSGDAAVSAALRARLEALAETRRALLDRAIAIDVALQRRLYALDNSVQQLEERTIAFDDFLAERLLWVRSTPSLSFATLRRFPGELATYLLPGSWSGSLLAVAQELRRSPSLWLPVIAGLFLFLRRRWLEDQLRASSSNVGSIRSDRLMPTLRGLGLTLLLALPLPLLIWSVAWAMSVTSDPTEFSEGLASALARTANLLLLLMILLSLYSKGGISVNHFGWQSATAANLRNSLKRISIICVPLFFIANSAFEVSSETSGGTHGMMAYMLFFATLAAFLASIFHPTKGDLSPEMALTQDGFWWHWRYVWWIAAITIPLFLLVLGLMGFGHTVVELSERLFLSISWLTILLTATAVARRWFALTRRRLDYEAAEKLADAKRVTAPIGGGEESGDDVEAVNEPLVDLAALDHDSRTLLSAAVVLFALLGLGSIWGQMLPALGILNNITLWNSTIILDDVQTIVAITLGDLLLAILIAVGAYLVGKNLPSLLDIILLKQRRILAGGRYAITTLTRYSVVLVATLLVLQTLGASWSQMGWAAAALGVGIGFGLQEIIANFVSGLILLFEQPVRVGDVITIGDASGTVSKIRIRATTIRDWDNKELIVPNKELVTGRLLNWSLSDAMIRVTLHVGIAYGSDVDKAMALLREAAEENENIVAEPEPRVVFSSFGDSSLGLDLRAYISDLNQRFPTISALHNAVDQKFRDAGIVIAFPQQDIHHYSGDGTRGDNPPDK